MTDLNEVAEDSIPALMRARHHELEMQQRFWVEARLAKEQLIARGYGFIDGKWRPQSADLRADFVSAYRTALQTGTALTKTSFVDGKLKIEPVEHRDMIKTLKD